MEISEELDKLSCQGIGYCLDLLEQGCILWPTLFTENPEAEGGIEAQSFEEDSPDAGLEAAHKAVSQLPTETLRYAIAYDGFIQAAEQDAAQTAIILEAGERGTESAFTACVPYAWAVDDEFQKMTFGNPIAGGMLPLAF